MIFHTSLSQYRSSTVAINAYIPTTDSQQIKLSIKHSK